jgi:hypothetical protein
MPPKTLTAEQVAEIDRQQKPAVNMRDVVPQREDVLAARITAQERREAAPAALTPEQADATEAQASVAAMTPFGRAMGAEPDRTTGPVFQPKKRLSAAEADQMQYEQISSPAYMPTKEEFQWYEGYKKTRDDKVSRFVQGATGMASGLVQAAAATAYAPFDLLVRGTPAWNEWVNSSAEGLRQTSIGLAELWSWGGDIYEDNQKELQRSRDLNNQIRQQLAAENKFTGNAQQDDQILEQAIEQAKAGGLYEKTADDLNADEDTRFERFIRDRSFQQQSANITETNIGTLPDSQREMGIDPSKVNPGLAFTAQLVFDPLNAVVPGGIGALSNLRLMRRTAALTGAPLKGLSKVAKASADKVEDLYGGILSGIESRTGLNEAAAMGALNNPVTWRAVAAMAALKTTGKVLRKSENWLETGSIIAKEASVGGVGISRADAAARLRNAPIPERYRRAYDGFFTSADSTLRRVSETPGLSPIARRSAATLDRAGVTQAFRLADDAVSGAAAVAPIGIPFAAIAPEDRQPEILGALLSIGAMGGVVGGQARRMSQMNDALVAKMLADAEISGGDAVAMANMLSPEKLADMARKQTMISAKADWVPLRAVDYELNKTVQEAVGNGTKGIYIEASAGKRPRVFLNLDKLASGDVAGHEIGHAIFMSDIMGGEIKQGMRAMVDVEYGADGLAARGREYAKAQLTQEVNQGATGIKLEVLTPEEVNRKAAGVSEADLIRDRWSNDSAWRDSAINDRIDLMNQERIARGGQPLDWARDEIAAETFSGLGKGVNLNGLRASGPLGRAVGAAQTALDMMGARFRGNGRLESPNKLFTENPLFDSPQMRKAVNDYVKMYDRYLVGLEKEGKIRQRGTPIAPTGRASDAARSPHTRLYPNKGVVESDLFVQRPDGTLELKSQQMINTQEKARAATLKSINSRDRFVPENSQEWGARRLSNGRVVVGGPTLPPQFDFFLQMPEWLRFKAREFEAGRNEGRSYLYSYNAIGTGADGSYKVKNLGNVEAKTGEAVPFGWDLSQKNHLLAKVIDLNSFRASSMRAIDNQLLGEFGNDLKAVEAGLKQLLKNYQDGVPGETNLGVTKKNILNGLLGTGTPTQRANNPAWHTLNNQGSIRTFRFDRLNYADPYGTGYFPHYDKLNINALPDNAGRMSLDEYMSFDADRQTAWLNNRARERGHSNSTNWQNSDEAGFAAAAEEYRKLFPRADAPMARGNAMPDVDARHADLEARYRAGDQGALRQAQTIADDAAKTQGYKVGPVYHWTPEQDFSVFDINKGREGFHFGTKQAAEDRSMYRPGRTIRAFLKGDRAPVRDMMTNNARELFRQLEREGRIKRKVETDYRGATEGVYNEQLVRAADEKWMLQNQDSLRGTRQALSAENERNYRQSVAEVEAKLGRPLRHPMQELQDMLGSEYTVFEYPNKAEDKGSMSYAVTRPEQVKSAEPFTYDDSGRLIPMSRRFDASRPDVRFMPDVADAPPFFLKSSQALDAKIQGKAATPDQVKAILTNPQNGIKAEELKWTGVMQEVERLAKENNGKVPKEALLRYLAEDGAVRFEEVTLRESGTKRNLANEEQLGRLGYSSEVSEDGLVMAFMDLNDPGDMMSAAEMRQFGLPAEAVRLADTIERSFYGSKGSARYGSYQLPGGENYREVVLAMPPIGGGQVVPHPEGRGFAIQYKDGSYEGGNTPTRWDSRGAAETTGMSFYKNAGGYTSPHFDTPNYVAHMRLNERVDAKGKPGLFIEELQSDRHQQGREHGYKEPFEQWIAFYDAGGTEVPIGYGRSEKQALESIDKNWEGLVKIQTRKRDGVEGVIPDAPFRTSWPLQLFKRALRDAVADGKEWIGWTTGETQAARYDLSTQVDSIRFERWDDGKGAGIFVEKNGDEIIARDATLAELPNIIGKELTERVMASKSDKGTFTGLDLKVGGEGMKGFYDTMVPKDVAKYVKQWGGQVEKDGIGSERKVLNPSDFIEWHRAQNPNATEAQSRIAWAESTGAQRASAKRWKFKDVPIWRVNITPQMREGIKKAGQALFVGGAAAVVAEDQLE